MTLDVGETVDLAGLARGRDVDVPVVGSSMVPWVRNGDRVRVASARRITPRLGDIVLVVLDGRWVLHRLVEIDGDRAVTRGDNRFGADSAVSRVRLQGVALWCRRGTSHRRIPLRWPGPLRRGWLEVAPLVRIAVRTASWARGRGVGRLG